MGSVRYIRRVALSIDLGLFRKFKNIIIKQKKGNSIPNQTQDILLDSTNYESSQKLQQ
jgi:hypothetical protein